MSEERKTADEDAVGEDDSRRQLWMRAGIAVGLIGLLLGGLAVFDQQSRPPPVEEAALPTKPIAPAQVMPEVGRDAPPDVVRAGGEAVPPAPAPVEEVPPPVLPAPGKAGRGEHLESPAGVAEGGRPTARPAHAAGSAASAARGEPARKAAEPASQPAPVPPARTATTPPAKVTAAAAPAGAAAPAVPVAAAVPAASGAIPPTPAAARPAPAQVASEAAPRAAAAPEGPSAPVRKTAAEGAFYLQLGAYPSAEQAEVLRARLSAEGVPSHLETRVLVGPFSDRRDALAAQARLREKGFTPGDLIPFRR